VTLDIQPSNVQHLAMALFNVQLASEGGLSILFVKGYKLSKDEDIVAVFDPERYNAILESRLRLEEIRQARPLADCVSMTVTKRADKGASMNLTLKLERGMDIASKLYL